MSNEFGLLNNDEVLYVRSGSVLVPNATFKASEFLDALAQLVSEREDEWSDEQEGWFNERGLNCEVLRFGNQGWQKGRVRIRMEFVPEGPKMLKEAPPQREKAPYQDDIFKPRDSYQQSNRPGNRTDRGRDSYPEIYPDIDDEY
jgi:KGK domain